MKASHIKLLWLYFSIAAAAFMGGYTFANPRNFIPLTDLLATIVSILIGVTLAISALLATSPKISITHYKDEAERQRIQTIINNDDKNIIDAQTVVFWSYYWTLILAIALKWLSVEDPLLNNSIFLRTLSALFALVSTFALLWSATLPNLLRQINLQRKELEN